MSSRGIRRKLGGPAQPVLTDFFRGGKRHVVDPPSVKLRKVETSNFDGVSSQKPEKCKIIAEVPTLKTPAPDQLKEGTHCPNDVAPLTARKRKVPALPDSKPKSSPGRFPKRNLNFDDDQTCDGLQAPELQDISPEKKLVPCKEAQKPVKKPAPVQLAKNVADLQKRLAQFSESAARLNIRKQEILQKDTSPLKKDILGGKPQQTVKTPEKIVLPTVRQEERSSKFADQIRKDLPLPSNHQFLLDSFRATETVVSILYNRDEIISYEKIKLPVQQITKRNFTKQHLAQMRQVYPEAYSIDLKKYVPKIGERVKTGAYDLRITPNLSSDLFQYTCRTPKKSPMKPGLSLSLAPSSPLKAENGDKTPAIGDECADQKRKLTVEHQNVRRHVFRSNLMKHAHEHHKNFLQTLATPIKWTEADMVKSVRWHPAFKLDSVPDIVEADLPRPAKVEGITSAKQFLQLDRPKLDKKVELAISVVASKSEEKIEDKPSTSSETVEIAAPALENKYKGISSKLLEKIRAKEAAKKKADMLTDPVKELRIKRLKRLPDIYRIMRTYLMSVGGNKSTVPQEIIVKKLIECCEFCRDPTEMTEHIALLLEIIPEYMSKAEMKMVVYLKLDIKPKVSDVLAKIAAVLDKC